MFLSVLSLLNYCKFNFNLGLLDRILINACLFFSGLLPSHLSFHGFSSCLSRFYIPWVKSVCLLATLSKIIQHCSWDFFFLNTSNSVPLHSSILLLITEFRRQENFFFRPQITLFSSQGQSLTVKTHTVLLLMAEVSVILLLLNS